MKAHEALSHFEDFMRRRGATVDNLAHDGAVQLMLDFYRDVRAEDCDLEAGGDMLLFHWGTYDRGEGEAFEYDIKRQLIREPYDDEILQLSLTLKYRPTQALRHVVSGNRWCEHAEELSGFAAFIRACEASMIVAGERPFAIDLEFEDVE